MYCNYDDWIQTATELGIEEIPDYWKNHWHEYVEWKLAGRCDREPAYFSQQAKEIYSFPEEAMPELESISLVIQANPHLTELLDLYHFFMFHLPGGRGIGSNVMPAPKILGDKASLFPIMVLVSGAEHALEAFRAKGINDQIALDTLAMGGHYLRDHMTRYGTWGVSYLGWMRNHVRAHIVRLGRLMYNDVTYNWAFRVFRHIHTKELITFCESSQRYRSDGLADGTNGIFDPDAWTPELRIGPHTIEGHPVSQSGEACRKTRVISADLWEQAIGPGDQMVSVHIPGYGTGGKLIHEDCLKSYQMALEFFPRFYPDLNFTCFTCWSWMLDPNLTKLLPPESNLIKFQSTYHILPVVGDEKQAYDLVFRQPFDHISKAPNKTSLQRAIIEYVTAGNRLHSAAGYMTLDEVRALVSGL